MDVIAGALQCQQEMDAVVDAGAKQQRDGGEAGEIPAQSEHTHRCGQSAESTTEQQHREKQIAGIAESDEQGQSEHAKNGDELPV